MLGAVVVAYHVVTFRCLYISVVTVGAAHSLYQQAIISVPFYPGFALISFLISHFSKRAGMKKTSIFFSVISGLSLLGVILICYTLLSGDFKDMPILGK